jgi:hypothetical protein
MLHPPIEDFTKARTVQSSLHWNVEPVSVEEKVNDGLVDVEPGGSEVIVVCGGVVSTFHV